MEIRSSSSRLQLQSLGGNLFLIKRGLEPHDRRRSHVSFAHRTHEPFAGQSAIGGDGTKPITTAGYAVFGRGDAAGTLVQQHFPSQARCPSCDVDRCRERPSFSSS